MKNLLYTLAISGMLVTAGCEQEPKYMEGVVTKKNFDHGRDLNALNVMGTNGITYQILVRCGGEAMDNLSTGDRIFFLTKDKSGHSYFNRKYIDELPAEGIIKKQKSLDERTGPLD